MTSQASYMDELTTTPISTLFEPTRKFSPKAILRHIGDIRDNIFGKYGGSSSSPMREKIYSDTKTIFTTEIPERDLSPRSIPLDVRKKLEALEAVAGMLNDLTPEQREVFENSIKRKPLFG